LSGILYVLFNSMTELSTFSLGLGKLRPFSSNDRTEVTYQ
jgi:hypothetical protein